MTIDEILAGFRHFQGRYERECVEEAIARKEEITPHLIRILEDVAAEPSPFIEGEGARVDHIYAAMLLGHFRESRAHRTIIDCFRFSEPLLRDIFGDLVTEDLPMILVRTCGGTISSLKEVAEDRKLDVFVRLAALHAMSYAIVEGIVSRDEVIDYYGSLFTGEEDSGSNDFWSLLACNVHELYPEELMGTINDAYRHGLINPGVISLENFQQTLEAGKEETLRLHRQSYERAQLDDLHRAMDWWACFHENEKETMPELPAGLQMPVPSPKKRDKKKVKRKKKQAKASRRKNRKR